MAVARLGFFLILVLGAVSAEPYPGLIEDPSGFLPPLSVVCEELGGEDLVLFFLGMDDGLCEIDAADPYASGPPPPGCILLDPEIFAALGFTSIVGSNGTHSIEIGLGGLPITPEAFLIDPEELLKELSVVPSWAEDLGPAIAATIVDLVTKLEACLGGFDPSLPAPAGVDEDACDALLGPLDPSIGDPSKLDSYAGGVPPEFIFLELLALISDVLAGTRWYGKKDDLVCVPIGLGGPGMGLCAEGISDRANVACCAASCGVCGSCGCSLLPGGADVCCPNAIVANGIECMVASDVGCLLAMPGITPPSLGPQGPGCP